MQTFHKKLESKLHYPLNKPYNTTEVLFFDIETTGFLASASYLYLIGAMYYKDDSWHLIQWFADDIQSEQQVLESFLCFLVPFKRIIHYNGSSFDLPYLDQKCKHYKLNNPLKSIDSFDLYKKLSPYKKILPVINLKLKTVESFVGIHREDKLSGEELIQIYANYLGKYQYEKLLLVKDNLSTSIPTFQRDAKTLVDGIKFYTSSKLQSLLLLHNAEDVTGLLAIGNLLYYTDIFENTQYQSLIKLDYQMSENHQITSLVLRKTLPFSFGNPVYIETTFIDQNLDTQILLSLSTNELTIQVPIYSNELKFFPDNYKDYYYLPLEDMVVHKSVAQFVDKEFRQKVKAKDCFLKKSTSFLPMPKPLFSPVYHFEYKDKSTFAEFNSSIFENTEILESYYYSLLEFIKTYGTIKN